MTPSSATTTTQSSVADRTQQAFHDAVESLIPTMPLLMHGSGDVAPSLVNPLSARFMAELTVQYISSLVDAAVDAQDMLLADRCHEKDARANFPIPPPLQEVRQRRIPPLPPVPTLQQPSNGSNDNNSSRRKQRRAVDDYWDEPLPAPKIRKAGEQDHAQIITNMNVVDHEFDQDDDEDQGHPMVPFDEWVGVAGVDFRKDRTRMAHVQAPFAIGTQCFIFPICHDAGLYGRVLEVQAAQRNIAPLLVDSVVMEMVRTEAVAASADAKRNNARSKQKKNNSNNGEQQGKSKRSNEDDEEEENEEVDEEEEEPEEEEEEDEFSRPTWPGLDSILPIYR